MVEIAKMTIKTTRIDIIHIWAKSMLPNKSTKGITTIRPNKEVDLNLAT